MCRYFGHCFSNTRFYGNLNRLSYNSVTTNNSIYSDMYHYVLIIMLQNGGPTWEVPLGRRDSRMAYKNGVTANIPTPSENLGRITQKFINAGLDSTDLVALSGGTIKCSVDLQSSKYLIYILVC